LISVSIPGICYINHIMSILKTIVVRSLRFILSFFLIYISDFCPTVAAVSTNKRHELFLHIQKYFNFAHTLLSRVVYVTNGNTYYTNFTLVRGETAATHKRKKSFVAFAQIESSVPEKIVVEFYGEHSMKYCNFTLNEKKTFAHIDHPFSFWMRPNVEILKHFVIKEFKQERYQITLHLTPRLKSDFFTDLIITFDLKPLQISKIIFIDNDHKVTSVFFQDVKYSSVFHPKYIRKSI